MINKIAQRYSLMKGIGLFYMAVASALLLGGMILALLLLRADFYADYRRGAHLVAAAFVFVPAVLTALGFFVQGSLANAVADIERTTRDNSAAIEVNRAVAEKAARTGQNAINNSEAMLHAQTALAAAQRAETALIAPLADVAVADSPARTEAPALPSAGTAVDISAFAPPTMKPPTAIPASQMTDLFDAVPETVSSQADLDVAAMEMDMIVPEGVINEGGTVTNLPQPTDSTDAAVQNLFSRAKGAVVRTRRPWQRNTTQPVFPAAGE